MGKIYYIMGKSASGKDHIYEALREDPRLDLSPLILYTTRPIRSGECNGREYFFVEEKELWDLRKAGRIIEERRYDTVYGPWYYFTADVGQFHLEDQNYIGIGTLESYQKMKEYFGEDRLCPIYIETEDGIRLQRALDREKKQGEPRYAEMCRRFLADCQDFSEEKIRQAGISTRFTNNGSLEECLERIRSELGGDCLSVWRV